VDKESLRIPFQIETVFIADGNGCRVRDTLAKELIFSEKVLR
jgi:hypothetical protein